MAMFSTPRAYEFGNTWAAKLVIYSKFGKKIRVILWKKKYRLELNIDYGKRQWSFLEY